MSRYNIPIGLGTKILGTALNPSNVLPAEIGPAYAQFLETLIRYVLARACSTVDKGEEAQMLFLTQLEAVAKQCGVKHSNKWTAELWDRLLDSPLEYLSLSDDNMEYKGFLFRVGRYCELIMPLVMSSWSESGISNLSSDKEHHLLENNLAGVENVIRDRMVSSLERIKTGTRVSIGAIGLVYTNIHAILSDHLV